MVITENHCEARAGAIERLLEAIESNPELDVARLDHGHMIPGEPGALGARWFDEIYEDWDRPEQWKRLDYAGILIRRETFLGVGGLEPRYGLYSAVLFAARLNESGARFGKVIDSGIEHIQPDGFDEHHGHTANYTRGECEARVSHDPVYAERWFGHNHLFQ